MSAISNGQLSAMEPDKRAEAIAALSPEVRMKLAHLAILGAEKTFSAALDHARAERKVFADWKDVDARRLCSLAAQLTSDAGGVS